MTTTVGRLLDDLHARAWGLCAELDVQQADVHGGDRAAELLAAWPRLATAALRVLDAVPLEPAWLDDMGSVRLVLGEVRRGLPPTAGGGSAAVPASPDPALVDMATRVGLIADLLAGERPARTDVDRAAVEGLQANVVAVVHAVAVASLVTLEDRNDLQEPRWLLSGLRARTERFATIPAAGRSGRYEDVGAVPATDSLDAAFSGWVRATVRVLTSRREVSQAALQVAAGDALILTAAAGTVCAAARQLGVVDADLARVSGSALEAAHAAWRKPTSWPSTVRLEGVRDLDHIRASRQVRQLVTDRLREGRTWLTPERMADQFDMGSLMGTMRRGMHAAGNVALAHFQAFDTLVRGRGRLWIAASAVTQAAYRGPATIQAALRHGWVQMPPGEPAGRTLHVDAKHALDMTTMALAAFDRTAASFPTPQPAGGLRWDRGRIVAVETTDQPILFETVRSSTLSGARAEQRNPTQLRRRPAPGPRR